MRRIWQTMSDEPFIAFAIIGGLLFMLHGFRNTADQATVETIEVRPATVRALEQVQQDLVGRPLTDKERQEIVEGFIEDEVLMREAFRRGLEKKDSRVRKRLLNVMRSTLDQPVAQPTQPELQAYFQEHRDQYVTGETISFDHVFFGYGSADEPADMAEFLKGLRAGQDHTQLGDYTVFGRILRDRSRNQLRRMVGPEFAEQAFALEPNQWHGPIESRHGVHFLRIIERKDPAPPSFEQMEEYLRQDWMFRKRREIQAEKIAEMRKRYRIVYAKEQ